MIRHRCSFNSPRVPPNQGPDPQRSPSVHPPSAEQATSICWRTSSANHLQTRWSRSPLLMRSQNALTTGWDHFLFLFSWPVAYELTLPPTWHIHPVFHISLLKKYVGTTPVRPPPILVDDSPEYEVEALLRHRYLCGHLQLLVLWKRLSYLGGYIGTCCKSSQCSTSSSSVCTGSPPIVLNYEDAVPFSRGAVGMVLLFYSVTCNGIHSVAC